MLRLLNGLGGRIFSTLILSCQCHCQGTYNGSVAAELRVVRRCPGRMKATIPIMLYPPNAVELVGQEKELHPDQAWLLKDFLGKSQEEARALYEARPYDITEYFMWMTPEGLRFYLPPFLDYLQSEAGKRSWEAASGILCSLSIQIEQHPQLPQDVLSLAKQICAYVKQNCKRFGIDPHDELYRECLKTIEGAKQQSTTESRRKSRR